MISAATAGTKKAGMVYDPANGFSVRKLARDRSIPVISSVKGLAWTSLCTAAGQEQSLLSCLKERQIPAYVPTYMDEAGKAVPFFRGIVFAAMNKKMQKELEGLLRITEIRSAGGNEEQILAELKMMTIAEQISRFYPFEYLKAMPDTAGKQNMQMKIDGLGNARIAYDSRTETAQIYFEFRITDTVIRFNLSLFQFRSLMLSNLLFTNKYTA